MKKLIYVAGPYTSDTCEGVAMNVRIAEEHGKQVLLAGHVPLVPHRTSAILKGLQYVFPAEAR
jgi:hypothetical protein